MAARLVAISAALVLLCASLATAKVERVVLISVDGLHASDLTWIVKKWPNGAIATLRKSGIHYPNAYIQSNTDSFPGVLALTTGANPKTTGVYYDDSYDRSLWAPGTKCVGGKPQGAPGTEVVLDESIDMDSNDIQGGADSSPKAINPAALPLDANCKPVYPHLFNRINNTIFSAVKAAGGLTAWTDKHPAYDLLQGQTGKGIDQLYTPEINSGNIGFGFTSGDGSTPVYDSLHLTAMINWLKGKDWQGNTVAGWKAPTLLGGNFQSVSVAEKQPAGGYNADLTPSPYLESALWFIDYAVSQLVATLQSTGLAATTAVVITAKHGQSPINPKLVNLLPSAAIPDYLAANNVVVSQATQDDVALLWLKDSTQADAAAALLMKNASALGIQEVYSGKSLLALGWAGNPATDSRAPDVIVKVVPGTIYVGKPAKKSKIAEHGGVNVDDQNVALLVSYPGAKPAVEKSKVYTVQVAPSVLKLLGLDPTVLDGVKAEGTAALPGL